MANTLKIFAQVFTDMWQLHLHFLFTKLFYKKNSTTFFCVTNIWEAHKVQKLYCED